MASSQRLPGVEILPVPRVADMAAVQLQLQSIGIDEIGSVQSPRSAPGTTILSFQGLATPERSLAANEEFMWEIAWAKNDASTPIRRRFHAQLLPNYNPSMVQRSIRLKSIYRGPAVSRTFSVSPRDVGKYEGALGRALQNHPRHDESRCEPRHRRTR